MDDLLLNISSVKKNNKNKTTHQTNASKYNFISKPAVTGTILARKRPNNVRNTITIGKSDEPKQKVTKVNDASGVKPMNFESNLRDLSENKGKFKEKNYQQISDELQLKQKPRPSGSWISSLFKNNPDVPRIGQKAVKPIIEKVFAAQTFSELDLHPHSIANLQQNLNLKQLMTVQQSSIPVILQGRDVLIRSQTGSGKTLAYALPIIEGLQAIRPKINRHDGIRVVVVVPTRELAVQTYELFVKLVKPFICIVPGLLSGGQKRKAEKARLRKGLSILVGTPGRINDHLRNTHSLNFAKTGCLVLDEADRLLDMGYEKDIAAIVKAIEDHKKAATYDPIALVRQSVNKNVSNDEKSTITNDITKNEVSHNLTEVFLSNNRQTILLSATLTKAVENLAGITMQDPVFIDTSEGKVLVADSLKHVTVNKTDDSKNKTPEINKSNPLSPKSDLLSKPNHITPIENEKKLTNDVSSLNNFETKRGLLAFAGLNINQANDEKCKKKDITTLTGPETNSDSDSDYEYFKVQKELDTTKPKEVEQVVEMKPVDTENNFVEALKSAVVEDELVLPASVNQKFLIVPMKLRLVTLCSLIVEHCFLNKKSGKMIVFMATTEMVDYHSELIETVLTRKEAKVNKKDIKNKKNKSKKKKSNNDDSEDSSGSSGNTDSEFEMEYDAPEEGGLIPIDLDVFSLHGSMPHATRMEVFKQFRAARRGLLICTDVAARGLDVPRVDLVLQYCAPASATDYVHRVGRTGRAAQVGAAILMLLPSEAEFVRHLEQKRIRLRQADESQSLEPLRALSPAAPSPARAAIAVQTRLEHTAHSNRDWLARASRAYTSWVRFYSGYPREVRMWLDARQLHLGHAAKAFALRETPAALARRAKSDPNLKKERPVNRLTVREEEEKKRPGFPKVKPGLFGNRVTNSQSSMHTASEFDSGLPPLNAYNQKKNKNKRTL